MTQEKGKKFTVKQVLAIQVIISFVVIAILVALGGLLVFVVMGTEYTSFTSAGFIATVYLAFITFQPAGTLFSARKEFIEEKVDLSTTTSTAPAGGVNNPWTMTLPVTIPVAVVFTALIPGAIYLSGWKPSPTITVCLSLLFVIPHYLITRVFIERDLMSLAAGGPGAKAGVSGSSYFLGTYIVPNIIFQAIINGALANRGFHHAMMQLSHEYPNLQGLVPVQAVAADLAVTFIFVCNFTFLAAIMYTLSGIYLGIISLEGIGTGKPANGFFMFGFMLLLGLVFGILYGVILHAAGIQVFSFMAAMVSKLACVIIAVYLGSRMARTWAAKKVMAHLAAQTAD